jgi:hypothetical protein
VNTASVSFVVTALPFPAGTSAVDHVSVALTSPALATPDLANVAFANIGTPLQFVNLEPGDYTVTVTNHDTAGNTLGSPVVKTFSIAAPATVTISLVTDASVSVA